LRDVDYGANRWYIKSRDGMAVFRMAHALDMAIDHVARHMTTSLETAKSGKT
jgi:hypothetical protein